MEPIIIEGPIDDVESSDLEWFGLECDIHGNLKDADLRDCVGFDTPRDVEFELEQMGAAVREDMPGVYRIDDPEIGVHYQRIVGLLPNREEL